MHKSIKNVQQCAWKRYGLLVKGRNGDEFRNYRRWKMKKGEDDAWRKNETNAHINCLHSIFELSFELCIIGGALKQQSFLKVKVKFFGVVWMQDKSTETIWVV